MRGQRAGVAGRDDALREHATGAAEVDRDRFGVEHGRQAVDDDRLPAAGQLQRALLVHDRVAIGDRRAAALEQRIAVAAVDRQRGIGGGGGASRERSWRASARWRGMVAFRLHGRGAAMITGHQCARVADAVAHHAWFVVDRRLRCC